MAIKAVDPLGALRQYGFNPLIHDPRLRTMLPGQFQVTQEAGWQYGGPDAGFENPEAMHPEGGRWPTFGVVEGPGAPGSIPAVNALRGLRKVR